MTEKPLVVITGAVGNIGLSLASELKHYYRIVDVDRLPGDASFPIIEADFSDGSSVDKAFTELRQRFGHRIASLVHHVAYFDFTGGYSPLYGSVNAPAPPRTRRLRG